MLSNIEEERVDEVSVEHAFDYDGCLGDYHGEEMPEAFQVDDVEFWQTLKEEMHRETEGLPRDRRRISIATARQCHASDLLGMEVNASPSCFPLYQERATFLEATLDTFLLSDIRGNLSEGTSFSRIMDPSNQEAHTTWYYDVSKITLIYAKTHRAATLNPDGIAKFTFYDDRPDILDGLEAFFNSNLALLPDNLELNLCQYRRGMGLLYRYDVMHGTGDIDAHYQDTTEVLGMHINEETKKNRAHFDVAGILSLRLERLFYDLRNPQVGYLYSFFEHTLNIVREEDEEDDDPIEVRRLTI
jgi:hypothetical protein